jgi:Glu-tRNA(Gln) amidotransferase subunit E-like FAD-binding protein
VVLDYNKLGFRCGLECHQQIDGLKLFCKCPTINSDAKSNLKVERKLRAAAGETGEIDIAAKHEMAKDLTFTYEGDNADCCLVDLDEQPPEPINQHALNTALEIALLLNCKIVDEIQFMRKTVVDGSNVSGFQRTALIGMDGHITTENGKVAIDSICLEEEAAKKLSKTDSTTTYRLDRLGIPLVEIATDASITSPNHCKEVAEKIGMILRSTGKVKRGLGTIRQDVNVSIKGHPRIEVKGFQDLKSIPKVIEKEIERQQQSMKKNTKLEGQVRKAEADFSTTFLRPMPGSARMYPETDIPLIKPNTKNIEKVDLIDDKILHLETTYKLNADLARALVNDPSINYPEYVEEFQHVEPSFIANTLINTPKEIKSRNKAAKPIDHGDIKEALNFLNEKKISKEAVFELLLQVAEGKKMDIHQFKKADTSNLDKEVQDLIKQKPNLNIGAYMGLLMAKYRGKVDGKELMQVLRKHVK